MSFAHNFNITSADSPLGDLRLLIDKFGYGCFLESAQGLDFYEEKILPLQLKLIKQAGDAEVHMAQTALSGLSEKEIQIWKQNLERCHQDLL